MKVKKPSEFESGHPDNKTRTQCGFYNNKSGTLATLDNFDESCLKLGVENPNQKTNLEMIKSVEMKTEGRKWYVEYRELDIETNVWHRHREARGINREKDLDKRKELIQDLFNEIMSGIVTRHTNLRAGESEIKNYIKAYLHDKGNFLRGTSIKNITLTLRYFYEFLQKNNYNLIPLHQVRKRHVHEFRVYLSEFTSNRSVNGHMGFLKSFFNYYIDNYDDVLYKNPCVGVKKLPTASETHVAYSDEQVKSCFAYMERHNPYLLFYCKFVGLAFVRCEETRNLKINCIDFKRKTITLEAGYSKTRTRIIKPLMNTFFNEIVRAKLHNYPANYYIFSESGTPGEKPVGKNYFRKQFKKLKEDLGLSTKHTIYSFRHTFVSQLLDNGAKWHKVMQYTGHTTMEAFSAYARSLHIKPTEDLSMFLNQ